LTGDEGGAPYIPVRFGAVHLQSSGSEIRNASIEILRMSANTIRLKVELYDEEGNLVALLDDCRFRRTFLKLHQTLETVSFHYERVTHNGRSNAARILASGARQIENVPLGLSALLLDAAVYRACYDLVKKSVDLGLDNLSALSMHPALRAHLANCYLTLEDCGLAVVDGGRWILQPDQDLPPMDELVREVLAASPDSGAAIILVNDVFCFTMGALEKVATSCDVPEYKSSEATIEHFKNASGLARKRVHIVFDAVRDFLEQASRSRSGLVIAEIGATSLGVTSRLAALAGQFDARLVVVEPDENLRRTLEVAMGNNPAVTISAGESPTISYRADLVFSANGYLSQFLQPQSELGAALRSFAAAGAEIFLVEHPSAALTDFIFGIQDDWFAQSSVIDLPIGRMQTTGDLKLRLSDFGFDFVTTKDVILAEGALAIFTGKGQTSSAELVQMQIRESLITVRVKDAAFLELSAKYHIDLPFSSEITQEMAVAVLCEVGVEDLDIVYVLPAFLNDLPSQEIQDHVGVIGKLAEAVRQVVAERHHLRPRLIIVAPGGASVRETGINAVNYAIWMFARVLQNEYDDIDVLLVDVAQGTMSPKVWFELLTLQEKGESELLLDAATGLIQAVRVVPGPVPHAARLTTGFAAATIVQKSPGRIESIGWQDEALPHPEPDEVMVKISATGLNFRDVMWAMGLLPEEALEDGFAGATIGMEFSGTVVSLGERVSDLTVGDRVMGIGPKAVSRHVCVSRMGVTKVPDKVGTIEAASLPVTFLTAQYALSELANLRSGECVLIHGAAGGVGLAALQIAKAKGASVIATAGSDEKRSLLSALGADFVFDSRSLDFVNDVLSVTGEQGVDVVVNSLFSEAMERSIELVKPFGRFLELGKRDYYSDRKISLRPFRKNISYFGIDADQLLVDVPHVAAKIFGELTVLFDNGTLRPLPYRLFGYDELPTAFRLMQSAGHIGKIVVTPPKADSDAVQSKKSTAFTLADGVYLVVGGVGGFGLEAANWLAAKGASHIALATRSGVLDDETRGVIEHWVKAGKSFSVHACDVTDEIALTELLETLRHIGPLKGVVHAAMVLDDALICNLTRERSQLVIDTKVRGAYLLDKFTRQDELQLFLMFSSATTMIGNPGQSNYVAANGYLEGLARKRRQFDLPALAVGFGAIADTGFLARHAGVNEALSHRIGKSTLKARDALRFTEEYLTVTENTPANASVMIADIDWAAASSLKTVKTTVFSAIGISEFRQLSADGDQLDLYGLIDGKTLSETDEILHGLIASELSSILKLAENNITSDKILRDIGLDSLMAMELGTSFQQKTGIDLPLSSISDATTVGHIVGKLKDKLSSQRSSASVGEQEEMLEALTSRHTNSNSTAA
jgi:NADPH:quinone reductase-like Zn-dependent oxidoreductase/acyl carrier protein